MSVAAPNPDTLRYLRNRAGLDQAQLAAAAGLSLRRIAQLEQGLAKSMHPANKARLARALSVDEAELDKECVFQEKPPSTQFNASALASGIPIQARKNLIRDQSLSERLLQASSLPSFVECVEASSTELPREEDKDVPHDPRWGYNHFLQAAAVISVNCTEDDLRQVLGYYRMARPGIPEHTPGLAILWGASFLYNVLDFSPTPMDRWMTEARCFPVRAKNRFTAERGSVLTSLLAYKITLADLPLDIAPYAVITTDQRDNTTGVRRVYTQYLFDVRLPPWKSTEGFMTDFQDRARGLHLCLLPYVAATAHKQERQFSDPATGRRNLMDILAWRGMFTRARQLSIENATLTKGVDLLPKRIREKAIG